MNGTNHLVCKTHSFIITFEQYYKYLRIFPLLFRFLAFFSQTISDLQCLSQKSMMPYILSITRCQENDKKLRFIFINELTRTYLYSVNKDIIL